MTPRRPFPRQADILLTIAPPFLLKMPSIGVAYLASFLKSKGFHAAVADLSLDLFRCGDADARQFWDIGCLNSCFSRDIAERLLRRFDNEIKSFVTDFLASTIPVLGISINIISIYVANEIARMIKEADPRRLVIFGGPGTFYKHPRDLLVPNCADLCVVGEGEMTLLKILETLRRGRRIEAMPGVLLKHDYGRRQPLLPASIQDLDKIPFPTYREFDLGAYNPGHVYKPLPLLLSRGCIRTCTYCIDHQMWPRYRFRSGEGVMAEISHHVRIHDAKAFEFIDLACNGNLDQLLALSEHIIASGMKFDWVSYALVRRDMNDVLLKKLREAGCHTLIFGVESGSDKILRKMGKGYTAAEAARLIRQTHEAGICVNVNMIVGFPGETEEDFRCSVDFIADNKEYINEVTNISGCTLFPEAALGRHRKSFGIVWEEGTDPMLFYDTNGLDREGRHRRVAEFTDKVSRLGITKSIVNKPVLNPAVKALLDHEKMA